MKVREEPELEVLVEQALARDSRSASAAAEAGLAALRDEDFDRMAAAFAPATDRAGRAPGERR